MFDRKTLPLLALIVFVQASESAMAQAPASAPAPSAAKVAAPGEKPAKKPEDPARWNDRSTPRKTLETFYFAITGYDRSTGLIANAIDCLDLVGLDPDMRERDAALLAHQLEFILNRQAIPLYSVPNQPEGTNQLRR